MRNIRLRTKFLLSLLAISAGLTAATLAVVSYNVQKRVRESLQEDLKTSLNTYQIFDKQREESLARSAEMVASLPTVRALMTTDDGPTIQDESQSIRQLSGSDLLVLADRRGELEGLQANAADFTAAAAQKLLQNTLEAGRTGDWWYGAGHLYEVRIQPIYVGEGSDSTSLGLLAVGKEINNRTAADFSSIVASQVIFRSGDNIVASTLRGAGAAQGGGAYSSSASSSGASSGKSEEVQIGSERFLESSVNLSGDATPPVTLSVLKSLDQATAFLSRLNHVLLGLGLLSVVAGGALVFFISDTFTRPLSGLVSGVRALERGDFDYPLENAGGDEVAEVTGAFARMRVTLRNSQQEEKRLEDRLRQAHKMEAVGRLAGGVAHDFNNLLTIIRGNGDILADREGADNLQKRCVDQIRNAAGRAVSMTRQLLAFSRMQVLQPRVLDVNTIVSEMGKMLPRLIGEHIEYSYVPEANLAPVLADPGQLEQVILNLAVNARDAMPDGGKLTVRTRNVIMDAREAGKRPPMTPGNYVLLSVADTGQGIDEETKTHIFEPFFTTKQIGKGTGLGLATVYGVVKQSDGFVWVESALGKGATFEIYLPQSAKSVLEADIEAASGTLPGGSETILVVEDEEGVRQLAALFLSEKGYLVLQANNGAEALEIAARHAGAIHLVLSDMVMPRMNGRKMAEELKRARPETKFLFMTGYAEYPGKRGAEKDSAGAAEIAVMQKPFSKQSLLKTVHETLTADSVAQLAGSTRERIG
jgi:signal transduction histidine kinase/CheY-like chemotaxis protein